MMKGENLITKFHHARTWPDQLCDDRGRIDFPGRAGLPVLDDSTAHTVLFVVGPEVILGVLPIGAPVTGPGAIDGTVKPGGLLGRGGSGFP